MTLDWDKWRFALDVVVIVVVALNTVYTWWTSRTRATQAAIDRVDGHLGEQVRRIDRLEVRVDDAPDHDDLAALHEKLNDVGGSLRALNGEMGGIRRAVDLIHRHLMRDDAP